MVGSSTRLPLLRLAGGDRFAFYAWNSLFLSFNGTQGSDEFFEGFDKPFLCAFADNDPVTKGGDAAFIERVPGAKGQPHTTIKGGGHFVQELAPEQVQKVIIDFIAATR